MARGGKREGAGRKRGVPNRLTRETLNQARAGGILPLDYMLEVLRNPENSQMDRLEAAKAAAPYCHPKLAAISPETKPKDAGPPATEVTFQDFPVVPADRFAALRDKLLNADLPPRRERPK